MESLRILLTNVKLATRTGTELYIRDLALRLLQRGHAPVVYTPQLGPVADELQLATVPVVDDLATLGDWTPQVVHGHHTLETILALLRFPGVPAIFVCHDWSSWHDEAPPLERVVFYVAVDDTCRDRLHLRHGVPTDRLRVVYNWVDPVRFHPRGPLPGHPERALLFSNYAWEGSHLGPVREACERLGIHLDVVGIGVGVTSARPEHLLPTYDLVFAKAKSALEAMAVGAAVVLCDARGVGPMVTSKEFDRLRRLNFGARTLQGRLDADLILNEIKRYDPVDAAAVSARVREESALDGAVDQLLALYREAISAGARLTADPVGEARVLASFLRPVSKLIEDAEGLPASVQALRVEREQLGAERDQLVAERDQLVAERDQLGAERDQLLAERAQLLADHDWLRGELDGAAVAAELVRRGHAADLEQAQDREAEQRRRAEAAEEDRAAERIRYQQALAASCGVAGAHAGEAAALRRQLDAVAATFTFRLRDRLLGVPVAGRVLRLLTRLLRP